MEISINGLEGYVSEGKLKKKEYKSSYPKEFFSKLGDFGKAASVFGVIGGAIGYAIDQSWETTLECAAAFSLMPSIGLGPLFYNWKENAEKYVNAGGKVVYKEINKNPFKKSTKIILPLNHNSDNKDEKMELGTPFRGYVDSFYLE